MAHYGSIWQIEEKMGKQNDKRIANDVAEKREKLPRITHNLF